MVMFDHCVPGGKGTKTYAASRVDVKLWDCRSRLEVYVGLVAEYMVLTYCYYNIVLCITRGVRVKNKPCTSDRMYGDERFSLDDNFISVCLSSYPV